jgi:outer membrane protein OmpA-like peptidoglycan-associated protein
MNKTKLFFITFAFLMLGTAFGQDNTSTEDWLAKNSWAFGFGLDAPQYISTTLYVNGWRGYGVYASIQRNFTEHVGLRFLGNYNFMQGQVVAGGVKINNYSISGDFDLLYYLAPCEPVSPYFTVGVGNIFYHVAHSPEVANNWNDDFTINMGFGAEWHLAQDWKLTTELGFHQVGTSKFDGIYGTDGGGLLGDHTDSYMTAAVGAVYYFGKGAKSHYCDLYNGITGSSQIDYAKVEDIVKKYQTQPTEVDYNRIAEIDRENAPKVAASFEGKWVLIGVNFDFNKATLRPESLPILSNAAEILLTHPDIKVEIQGYTDNIGTDKYNKKLALERADAVRDFMVAKGVDASRMTTVGIGKSNPVSTNKTENGRMLNRRIEFKVQ